MTPELWDMITGPGTLGGGPAGIPETAAEAILELIWEAIQPEPDLKAR